MEKVDARATLESAPALGCRRSSQRTEEKRTRADDGGWRRVHFVTRETGYIALPRRENKRTGMCLAAFRHHLTLPSKVIVNVAFTIQRYGEVNENSRKYNFKIKLSRALILNNDTYMYE